jgi:hypothetical protein
MPDRDPASSLSAAEREESENFTTEDAIAKTEKNLTSESWWGGKTLERAMLEVVKAGFDVMNPPAGKRAPLSAALVRLDAALDTFTMVARDNV